MMPPRAHLHRVRLHVNGTDTGLEVRCAFSWWARARGLLGKRTARETLPGWGLWLKPCAAVHTLGMVCAIDVVFLSCEGRVVRMVAALRPWRCAVAWGAHSVLELQPGTLDHIRLKLGDRVNPGPDPVSRGPR